MSNETQCYTWCAGSILSQESGQFIRKKRFSKDFQNAENFQSIGEFLCPNTEMKARDAYVPFLAFKS